jgi:hypothetical protein
MDDVSFKRLGVSLEELGDLCGQMGDTAFVEEMRTIIHGPGWTTIAEGRSLRPL